MIFNRIAARDLGIRDNYKVADAPVRYPFLWNASRQDRTQWNGGVRNGLYIQALGRNTGEVLGVFADFAPIALSRADAAYVPRSSISRIIPSTLPDCRRSRKRSPCCVRRHGHERYSDSTSGWPRPANPCSTPIAAAATRCRNCSTCRAFGAPPSSRLARTRRCSSIRSAPPSPDCYWAR